MLKYRHTINIFHTVHNFQVYVFWKVIQIGHKTKIFWPRDIQIVSLEHVQMLPETRSEGVPQKDVPTTGN